MYYIRLLSSVVSGVLCDAQQCGLVCEGVVEIRADSSTSNVDDEVTELCPVAINAQLPANTEHSRICSGILTHPASATCLQFAAMIFAMLLERAVHRKSQSLE
ncbi:uncharacterized protein LOC116802324 [Drosophila sechellia]|uniref:uncharacterized protein LOC116802324 n=1 Tax=Drosophila sechellia TaxID=7238 RepID=UPI0013DD9B22|nr:uncharacterized protein LOC116802324 [Drosophila sechellia]